MAVAPNKRDRQKYPLPNKNDKFHPHNKTERNLAIYTLWLMGKYESDLAEQFQVSEPRINQIINHVAYRLREQRQ